MAWCGLVTHHHQHQVAHQMPCKCNDVIQCYCSIEILVDFLHFIFPHLCVCGFEMNIIILQFATVVSYAMHTPKLFLRVSHSAIQFE